MSIIRKQYFVNEEDNHGITVEADDKFFVVPTSGNPTVLEDVFQTLTVGTEVTKNTTFAEIVIKAAAVQADSCSDAEAAESALGMLISAN